MSDAKKIALVKGTKAITLEELRKAAIARKPGKVRSSGGGTEKVPSFSEDQILLKQKTAPPINNVDLIATKKYFHYIRQASWVSYARMIQLKGAWKKDHGSEEGFWEKEVLTQEEYNKVK